MITKNIKNAYTSNLDIFGKDAKHNVLYITGHSGSGKTTLSRELKRSCDTLIHLDGYTQGGELDSIHDKRFDGYLDTKVPLWREIGKSAIHESYIKQFSDEYWKIVDEFLNAITQYSIEEFESGYSVIVEGLQLIYSWFIHPKKLIGNPLIILSTDMNTSMERCNHRYEFDSDDEYFEWFAENDDLIKYLIRVTNSDFLKGQ